MLLSARRLIGRNVVGSDDLIGVLQDIFFAERSGNVRHAVVKTGDWLGGREILLAPQSFEHIRPDGFDLQTRLTRHLVEHNPLRGDELGLVEPELRSVVEVIGHHLKAQDGDIGHLDDLLIDPLRWDVIYAVAKTRNWLPGRTVILPRAAVRQMRWDAKEVAVDLTREEIRKAPEFEDRILAPEA